MTAAVEILFAVGGIRDVQAAIGSIGNSLDRLARSGQQATERSVRFSINEEKRGAAEKERLARQAERDKERRLADDRRRQDRALADEVRATDRAEQEKRRIAEQAARAHEQIVRNSLRMEQQLREQAAREQEARARSLGRQASNSIGRVLGFAGRAAGLVGALGGGFTVADALQRGINQEAQSGVIFRGATNTGEFRNQADVQRLAQQTAIKTGGTTEDILGGLDAFVRKTGDLGVAKDMLEQMARLSAATGTSFHDMGDATAEVFNQLKDTQKTMEVMRALAGQGRAGAIDMKDLGEFGGRLASQATLFQGDAAENIKKFGAITQLAKKLGGATDAAEATMSLSRIGSDVAKHQDAFKQSGIEVFADKNHTKFRDVFDIITESVSKTKGDIGKLNDLFGERSIRAVLGAQQVFTQAGGGDAGAAAIRREFASLGKGTELSEEDVNQGVRGRLAETDAKVNQAMEQLRATINERLLPKLPDLIDRLTQLIPAIQSVLDFFINHPFSGLAGVIGVAIAADIAKAQLGNLVASTIARLILGAQGGLGAIAGRLGGGGLGAVAGPAGKLAGGLAAAAAIGVVGKAAIDASFEGHQTAQGSTQSAILAGVNADVGLRSAKTPEQRAAAIIEARKRLADLHGRIAEGEASGRTGVIGQVGGIFSGAANFVTAGSIGKSFSAQQQADESARSLKNLKSEADDLSAAIKKMEQMFGELADAMPRGRSDPSDPNRGGTQ